MINQNHKDSLFFSEKIKEAQQKLKKENQKQLLLMNIFIFTMVFIFFFEKNISIWKTLFIFAFLSLFAWWLISLEKHNEQNIIRFMSLEDKNKILLIDVLNFKFKNDEIKVKDYLFTNKQNFINNEIKNIQVVTQVDFERKKQEFDLYNKKYDSREWMVTEKQAFQIIFDK